MNGEILLLFHTDSVSVCRLNYDGVIPDVFSTKILPVTKELGALGKRQVQDMHQFSYLRWSLFNPSITRHFCYFLTLKLSGVWVRNKSAKFNV